MVFSFSKIECWEKCPKQFAHRYVWRDALPEDPVRFERGNRIDSSLSEAISGEGLVPDEIAHAAPIVSAAKKLYEVRTKYKLGLDHALREVEYFQGPSLRWRMELDVVGYTTEQLTHVQIIDWKTGKNWGDKGQLALYAAAIFSTRPDVLKVTSRYVWLDQKEALEKEYTRGDEVGIWAGLEEKTIAIEAAIEADNFPAIKNKFCRWCPIAPHECKNKRG